MIICKGEGEFMIDVQNGEVIWTSHRSHYEARNHKNVEALEGSLGLDPKYIDLPNCPECNGYDDCMGCLTDDDHAPDRTDCIAFDEEAVSSSIMTALAKLSESERKEVL